MEFYEAVRKRRTIRKFQGPAGPEQLDRILNAGSEAPSAGNRQSWEFIVVDDPRNSANKIFSVCNPS